MKDFEEKYMNVSIITKLRDETTFNSKWNFATNTCKNI